LQAGQHQVLVDPGLGHDLIPGSPYSGSLRSRLRELGISSASIELVIFSHADSDHVSGGVDQSGQAAFPNARYVLLREEWAFWSAKPERLRLNPAEAQFLTEELCQMANNIPPERLVQLHDMLELVDSETEVLSGISIVAASGHTPGHSVIKLASGTEQLLFIGDLLYAPQDLENRDWYSVFDYDRRQAIATRQCTFAQAARERTLLMGYHLPFPGLGYVKQLGAGWRWESYLGHMPLAK
jgi:glyoxylase-like metal-dependent hydrolase (beta-lactamase superfamily II)